MAKQAVDLEDIQTNVSEPELGSLLNADSLGQWAWVLAYTAVLSSISVLRYHLWIANGLDLGEFEQGLWLIWHHGIMAPSTYTGQPIIATGGAWVLVLLAPLYSLGGVGLLLVLQSFALGTGYLFLRKLAPELGVSDRMAHLVGLVYLIYPTVIGANLFDFHPQTLGVPILFGLLWALLRKRWALVSLFGVLALMTDVVAPILLFGAALVVLFRKQFLAGVVLAVLAAAAGVMGGDILPTLGHGALPAWSNFFANLGSTPGAGLRNLLAHPALLFMWALHLRPWEYIAWMAAVPLAMMIFSGRFSFSLWWLPALFLMEMNLVSSQAIRTSPFNEFTLLAVPFIFMGLQDVLRGGMPAIGWRKAAQMAAIPVIMLAVFVWQQQRTYWHAIPPNANALLAAEALVPKEVPVVVQNLDAAHFADRQYEWLPAQAATRTLQPGTYIVLDLSASTGTTPSSVLDALQSSLARKGQATMVFSQKGVRVYRLVRPLTPTRAGA